MATPTKPQSAESHAQYVPGFHFVTGGLVMLNLFWSLYHAWMVRTGTSVDLIVIALSLLGIFWYARAFGVANQDRIIRLEERLRLSQLLPTDMQARTGEFTPDQLIAMRFASDAELPDLARTVLSKGTTTRAEIKGMIKTWRADHMRV